MARETKAQLEEKIARLEQQLETCWTLLNESDRKYNELMEAKELPFKELPIYSQMEKTIKDLETMNNAYKESVVRLKKNEKKLKGKIQRLAEENSQLKESLKNQNTFNDTIHNPRNAGRKPKSPEVLNRQLQQLNSLLDNGKTVKEICSYMGISRATYFRLKKLLKSQ